MISKFKVNNKMCSVANELWQLIDALKKCEKSPFVTDSLKTLTKMKKTVDKQLKNEWKEFVGKNRVLVSCSACQGDGYKSKYVGICCGDEVGESPYTRVRCSTCDGDGKVLIAKASI